MIMASKMGRVEQVGDETDIPAVDNSSEVSRRVDVKYTNS